MATNIFAPHLFEDKVILVTGAAGGVGGAVADQLYSLGARLALTDIDARLLAARAGTLDALGIPADMGSVGDCEAVVEKTLSRYDRLDGLVNCAGVWVEGKTEDASEADWERCIAVNLKGTFFMCSRAIPALKRSRGAIVNISSDAGVVGNAEAAIYCASKGGVTLLTRALAIELAPFGVRVNALCPSDIMSPMLEYQANTYGSGDPQGYFRNLLSHYPQREHSRFIEPGEVAQQVAWLLGPATEAVTGAAVMMDFGVTAGY